MTLGTTGQGQTLIDGLTHKKLKLQNVDGASKIYIDSGANSASTIIQIQSGEIAGFMAADIALTKQKNPWMILLKVSLLRLMRSSIWSGSRG